jgi:rSAM/selenodomain-associated transferase 1
MKPAILIFTKNLLYGQVKTRLAATVGNDVALSVYKNLLQYTAHITHQLPVDKILFYSNKIEKKDSWNDEVYNKQLQSGNDLGERIQHAFAFAFLERNTQVAIIGTDCLELTSTIIMNAFAQLKNHDVVIGPAKDGGYYLLAIKKLHQELFQNISWSTKEVLKQTLMICKRLNLTAYLLTELSDIDTEEDLNKINEKTIIAK